jgi:hypothetical protein
VGPTVGLFGFLAQVNTVSAEKLHACTALDISNIRPLKVKHFHMSALQYNGHILHANYVLSP